MIVKDFRKSQKRKWQTLESYAYRDIFWDILWYLPCAGMLPVEQEDHMKFAKSQKVRSRWLSAALLAFGASSMLSAMASQLNVFSVTDSVQTVQLRTFSDDAQTASRIAGFDPDIYEIVGDSGDANLVRTLTVEKRFPVRLKADGQAQIVQAVSQTVGEFLAKNGVALGPLDEVTPTADTVLTAEQTPVVQVVRVTQETETVRVKVPHETTKRTTGALRFGETRVVQQGVDGETEQVVRVTKRDGVESARETLSETVLTAPVTEVVESGTGGAVVTRGGETLRYSRVLDVKATAYSTQGWSHENKFTAIGTRCRVGAIAVDPKVIPLGSRLYITSPDGESWIYGTAVAEDTGSAIKGNRIDLYYNTQEECVQFGVRPAKVYVLS